MTGAKADDKSKLLPPGGRLHSHLQMDTTDHGQLLNSQLQKTMSTSKILGSSSKQQQQSTFNLMDGLTSGQRSKANLDTGDIMSSNTLSNELVEDMQIKILSYFGVREQVFDTLTQLSRKSLFFLRRNRQKLEQAIPNHFCEKTKLIAVKSLEEHQSGVNQILKLSSRELVTASDDCYLKYWSLQQPPTSSLSSPASSLIQNNTLQSNSAHLKVEMSIATETITCLAATGGQIGLPQKRELLVAGCHTGNLLIISNASVKTGGTAQQVRKEQVNNAHQNLIRVIVSIEALKHRYFVTADVCGIVKLWTSALKPAPILEIDLEQAMSYNSLIELTDVLPKSFSDTAMLACALKNQLIHIIVLMPLQQTYQIVKTIMTESQKPTCMIQLSSRHIAVAVGSLREPAHIEVHEISGETQRGPVAKLAHHKDMIDSIIKVEMPQIPGSNKPSSPYVQWLISASRDRQLTLWKLYDGQPLRRTASNLAHSQKKPSQSSRLLMSDRMSAEDYLRNKSFTQQQQQQQQQNDSSEEECSEEEDDGNPLMKTAKKPLKMVQESGQGQILERQRSDQNISQLLINNPVLESNVSVLLDNNNNRSFNMQEKQTLVKPEDEVMLDYFFTLDSGHKDFVRSMIQVNQENTLITGSEDKSIKIFTLTNGL